MFRRILGRVQSRSAVSLKFDKNGSILQIFVAVGQLGTKIVNRSPQRDGLAGSRTACRVVIADVLV